VYINCCGMKLKRYLMRVSCARSDRASGWSRKMFRFACAILIVPALISGDSKAEGKRNNGLLASPWLIFLAISDLFHTSSQPDVLPITTYTAFARTIKATVSRRWKHSETTCLFRVSKKGIIIFLCLVVDMILTSRTEDTMYRYRRTTMSKLSRSGS
jgi:hypothetical protein